MTDLMNNEIEFKDKNYWLAEQKQKSPDYNEILSKFGIYPILRATNSIGYLFQFKVNNSNLILDQIFITTDNPKPFNNIDAKIFEGFYFLNKNNASNIVYQIFNYYYPNCNYNLGFTGEMLLWKKLDNNHSYDYPIKNGFNYLLEIENDQIINIKPNPKV